MTSPAGGEDIAAFPEFDDYDVIVLNYDGAEWSEKTKEAFVAYVRGGGELSRSMAPITPSPTGPSTTKSSVLGVGVAQDFTIHRFTREMLAVRKAATKTGGLACFGSIAD